MGTIVIGSPMYNLTWKNKVTIETLHWYNKEKLGIYLVKTSYFIIELSAYRPRRQIMAS